MPKKRSPLKDEALPEQGASCSLLVVDDNDEARDLLLAALKKRGYEAAGAASGEEAVRLAKKKNYDVAVIDLVMPKMDGIETMIELKKADPNIEVIVATAHGSERLALEAIKQGAYAYLIMPFDLLELEALIPGTYERTDLKGLVGLYEATRIVFADVKLKNLLPGLMDVARKILSADDASVMLMGEDGKLRMSASSGLDLKLWETVQVALGERVSGRVAQWKTGVTINGPLAADPRFKDLPSRPDVTFSLVYPILYKDELLGVLCANRHKHRTHFMPQDLRHAAIFCSQIAQAIENSRLYEKLEEARKVAVEANALKDEFLYMTTHDLKSPLNIILGYAEVLLDPAIDEPAKRAAVERIIKSADHMLVLVKQLMRKGKLETAEFKVDKRLTAVEEIIDDCIGDFHVIAAKKKLLLNKVDRLPPGYKANVDPIGFSEILSNLLSNSIKYSDPGGEVRITLASSNGLLALSVTDTGPGIPPGDQERIFNKFQRGSSLNTEGTGYGLAIVKRLTEAHDGRVEFTSVPGEGTTFTVLLPEA